MGLIDGIILGAIFGGKSLLEFEELLNECQLFEAKEGVETFGYKGKMYDREKFIRLEMRRFDNAKYSDVKSAIASAEKKLEQGGEDAELASAQLSAYFRVLPQKKKSFFDI